MHQLSVTQQPCECGYLERAANDPDLPIVFDERVNEYHYHYEERRPSRWELLRRVMWGDNPRGATLVIYHCPFCGGAASESKRALLFEVISLEERERLLSLISRYKTIEEAVAQLGPPELEGNATHCTPETEHSPSRWDNTRQLIYQNLSEVADVYLIARADGSFDSVFTGKYRGDR